MDYIRINQYLLRKHHLIKREIPGTLMTISTDLVGLHATMNKTPYLSLFVRRDDFKRGEFDLEFNNRKSLGKIRSVRRTVFVYPKAVIPWMYAATKELYMPRIEQYFSFTGLTRGEYETFKKQIRMLLSERSLTAAEIKKGLKAKMSLSSIINLLCDEGQLIRGTSKSWKSNSYRYSLFSDYFPDINLAEYPSYEAQDILFEAYIDSYGPATISDICWWSGFTTARVREYIESNKKQLDMISCGNNAGYYILEKNREKLEKTGNIQQESVIFLPAHDPLIMGYKERDRYIDKKYFYHVFDKGGNSTSVIVKDGKIIGVWDCVEKPEPLIKLFFFKKPGSSVVKKAAACAIKMGSFILNKEPEIKTCECMRPLSERTMGGFMSPLKENF